MVIDIQPSFKMSSVESFGGARAVVNGGENIKSGGVTSKRQEKFVQSFFPHWFEYKKVWAKIKHIQIKRSSVSQSSYSISTFY